MVSSSLPLAIIQLESPPEAVLARAGEQYHWFVAALGLKEGEFIVVRPDLGETLPDPACVTAAILTGSWAMVTDHADWSERTAAWIRSAVDNGLPLLGVCYGHQLMAYALGGQVADNPKGWERGQQRLETQPGCQYDPLLSQLPGQFNAWLSHRQSVLKPPAGATVLATSALDACQIIRYSPSALSFQFHPEFTAEIMMACLPDRPQENGVMQESEPVWPRRLLQAFLQQRSPLSQTG
ncbi:glutamine amidotransferase [Erwinia tracheiphila]|nr:glutamine amidotransferase [Erwinia tracheiphila]EOS93212.1 glutamine amidotransferase [Erwinia tracheiphila PSU-1]KKF35761.1 glutamine amidotransferase [Erwinia tracheiphila]UIA81829.1 glutamine amidotransferase [Erwinia tracheiphila]UIA89944.1 glutamine amidotransferase [Erwinia tracheiphila]UIA90425.1 glutamine amidotransferase [Erwinia tracheiphila]